MESASVLSHHTGNPSAFGVQFGVLLRGMIEIAADLTAHKEYHVIGAQSHDVLFATMARLFPTELRCYATNSSDPITLPNAITTKIDSIERSVFQLSTRSASHSPLTYTTTNPSLPSPSPSVPVEDAIITAESSLGVSITNDTASLQYLALSKGSIALAHVVRVHDDERGIAADAFVDAHTNKLISIVNFVTQLTVRS